MVLVIGTLFLCDRKTQLYDIWISNKMLSNLISAQFSLASSQVTYTLFFRPFAILDIFL